MGGNRKLRKEGEFLGAPWSKWKAQEASKSVGKYGMAPSSEEEAGMTGPLD